VFDAYCAGCSRRQLISPTQVLGIINDDAGIHVAYRCRCGEAGMIHTGKAAHEA
jgi:hypothetical protein